MAEKKKKVRWFFPTNTNNLRMVLAQGLLSSPSGFSKYYQDALNDNSGYLPVYKNKVPAESITRAVSEAGHLIPCLLEIDFSGMSAEVKVLVKGAWQEVSLESITIELVEDVEQILIPLPMPLGCMSKIIFKNKQNQDEFKKDAETRSNIVLNGLKLQSTKADSKLFEVKQKDSPLSQEDFLNDQSINSFSHTCDEECGCFSGTQLVSPNYAMIYAYGGMLSLLFYFAKNGMMSHQYFDGFSKQNKMENDNPRDRLIPNFIHEYFHGGLNEEKPENKILKGVASACLEKSDFKNAVIEFLKNTDWDERLEKRSKEIASKLEEYGSSNSRSASQWFDKAKSDIEKILLMLFTREDSSSLIEYDNCNIHFSEREYVLFSVFFGMRDGFIKIPPFIRRYNGLQQYVSSQMAAYGHKKIKSSVSFDSVKPPTTVWQFVDKKMSKSTSQLLGLELCMQTIMPKADFKNENGKNVYRGYFEPTYKIMSENYFNTVSGKVISDADYNKLK